MNLNELERANTLAKHRMELLRDLEGLPESIEISVRGRSHGSELAARTAPAVRDYLLDLMQILERSLRDLGVDLPDQTT